MNQGIFFGKAGNPGSAEPQLGTHDEGNAELGLGAPGEEAEPGLGAPGEEAELGLGAPGEEAERGLGVPETSPRYYSRGYLPHLDDVTKLQSISFRLADSLPQNKLKQLEQELSHLPKEKQMLERRKQIEQWLDAGIGCCALKHPDVARVVQETLFRFDGEHYRLLAWCIMPNHVHVLIEPQETLGRIVQSWKSYTGRWVMGKNAELGLGVPGKSFWMREYWDRFIRNQEHLQSAVEYIHNNPVKAGLCETPADWPWSSARKAGSAEPRLGIKKKEKAELGLGVPGEKAELGLGVPGEKAELGLGAPRIFGAPGIFGGSDVISD